MTPRGIRNNNPGNIRKSKTLWVGESPQQTDPSFAQFTAPEYGIRAICKILRSYKAAGINTIQQIISRWAPPTENDTFSYTKSVEAALNVSRYDVIDIDSVMPALIAAIIQHENGQQPYSPDVIQKGISLAT